MARSIAEIKNTMTDAFMADATLREKYGLTGDDTFEGSFSPVALENILLYIVAACCHMLEALFDAHLAAVEEKVAYAVVASVPWYHKTALEFQYGDSLAFDETTQRYAYPADRPERRVVKYVAVRDRGNSIQVLASGEKGGLPEPLSDDVLTAFKAYMNRVKIAGVVLSVRSLPADRVAVTATVTIDPLVIDREGRAVATGTYPVREAVEGYLRGITYGGTFNKTRLVDAIQAVPGVTDVELGTCSYARSGDTSFTPIAGNDYTAEGGSFIAAGLENSLTYVEN